MAARKPRVLVLVDVQTEKGQNVSKAVSAKSGVKTVFKRVDLADLGQVKGMILDTVNEHGGLDVGC